MNRSSNKVLGEITEFFNSEGVTSPEAKSLHILSKCTQQDYSKIRADRCVVYESQYREALSMAKKHVCEGVPIQYLTNQAPFRYLDLYVDERVLIPRPESEMIVDIVKFYLKEHNVVNPLIADIGTGSGAIAISFAYELDKCEVVASDISKQAIEVATINADKYQVGEHISFLECDCLSGFEYFQHSRNHFDCIVSNPPYIPTPVYLSLDSSVKDNEPRVALDGGEDGLVVFDKILEQCKWMINDRGLFVFELHETCLESAAIRAKEAGLANVSIIKDLTGRDRFLVALG